MRMRFEPPTPNRPPRAHPAPHRVAATARRSTPTARSPRANRSTRGPAVAALALLAAAGCATMDAAPPSKAWTVEPVLDLRHAVASADDWYRLGRYHDGMRGWDRAVDAYRKAIAADASHVEAHNGLGVALAQRGLLSEAEAALRRAVELAPQHSHVRSNLGYVLLLADRPREAARELRAAVRLDAGSSVAMANLRVALERLQSAHADAAPAPTNVAATAVASTVTPAAGPPSGAAGSPIEVAAPITIVDLPAPAAVGTMPSMHVSDRPTVAPLQAGTTAPVSLPIVGVALPSPEPEAAVAAAPPSRVELSNGNGVTGMAARLKTWLANRGVTTHRLTNQRPYDQRQTVVHYRSGHHDAAERIARALPATAGTVADESLGARADVRVVLGRDWVRAAACLNGRGNCAPRSTEVADARSDR